MKYTNNSKYEKLNQVEKKNKEIQEEKSDSPSVNEVGTQWASRLDIDYWFFTLLTFYFRLSFY